MNGNRQPEQVRGVRRLAYLVLAVLFLGLGVLGIALPGVPTTPFLLLMSYFLIRSSPRLHDRVVRMAIVGGPIRDWEEKRGVRIHVKVIASLMVLAIVGASLYSQTVYLPIKVTVVVLAAVGLAVVWLLPTIKE